MKKKPLITGGVESEVVYRSDYEWERLWFEQESAAQLASAYLEAGGRQFANGRIERAVEYYAEAIRIARDIDDRVGVGAGLSALGTLYVKTADFDQAKTYYEDALTIAHQLAQPKIEGYLLFNISLTLDQLGQRDQAIGYAKQALQQLDHTDQPGREKVRSQLAHWGIRLSQDDSDNEQ